MSTDERVYAYAIGALPPSEAAEFEQHLTGCRACTDDVAALRAVTAELSSSVAAPPPPALRDAVLAAISDIPQRVSAEAQTPAADTMAPMAPSSHRAPQRFKVARWQRSRFSWAPSLLAAAAVIAALGFGGWAWQSRTSAHEAAQQASAQAAQLTDLLSAPDVKMATGRGVTSGTTGTVVLSPSRNEAVLVASDLPALPAGKVYQAWAIRRNPVPAGTFAPDGAEIVVKLPSSTLRASSVAVTVEPTGGSASPTSDAIVTVNVPQSS